MTDEGASLAFGRELDALRRERDMSFEELAHRSGVSATYLKDLARDRRGHGWPSDRVVRAIAAALDVEPDHFLIFQAREVLKHPGAVRAVYRKLKEKVAGDRPS